MPIIRFKFLHTTVHNNCVIINAISLLPIDEKHCVRNRIKDVQTCQSMQSTWNKARASNYAHSHPKTDF